MKLRLLFMAIGLSSTLTQTIEATAWKQGAKVLLDGVCIFAGAKFAVIDPAAERLGAAYYNYKREGYVPVASLYREEESWGEDDEGRLIEARLKRLGVIKDIKKKFQDYGVAQPYVYYNHSDGSNEAYSMGYGRFWFSKGFLLDYHNRPETSSGTVAHEAWHAINNDTNRAAFRFSGLYLATFAACKMAKRSLFSQKYISNPTVIRSLLKVPAGALMYVFADSVAKWSWSYDEVRADAYTVSQCTVVELRARARSFEEQEKDFYETRDEIRQYIVNLLKRSFVGDNLNSNDREQLKKIRQNPFEIVASYWAPKAVCESSLWFRATTEHPPRLERAEFFRQEAAKKEAFENNQMTSISIGGLSSAPTYKIGIQLPTDGK